MPETDLFFDDADSTREQIIEATFHALCEHGYSNLTLEKIGEEFEKSTSLIYHHYDGKDELLADLLEYLLETFEAEIPIRNEDPATQIHTVIDASFDPNEPAAGFDRALLELRTQSSHNDAFCDLFERTDALMRERLAQIIRAGIENGSFKEVDPNQAAALLHVTLLGAHASLCTNAGDMMAAARDELHRFVDEHLVR